MKSSIGLNRKLGFFIMTLVFVISLAGCNKDDAIENESNKIAEKSDDIKTEALERLEKVANDEEKSAEKNLKEKLSFDFLKGEWSGKFDGRKTVMVINDVEGNTFSGKITINYRNVINQEVKGSYDAEKNSITMEDQLHSRFKGKYDGKLSDDKKTFSGIFTMKVDGKKFDFNLKKK